jgi:hypothetical protein
MITSAKTFVHQPISRHTVLSPDVKVGERLNLFERSQVFQPSFAIHILYTKSLSKLELTHKLIVGALVTWAIYTQGQLLL